MPAIVANLFQRTHWASVLSMVLLSSFLLVSFVNLSVFEESGPLEVPLLFSTLSESDVTDDLPGVLEQIKNEPERSLLRTHLNETPYWVYSPLQKCLSPVVRVIPRNFHYKNIKFPIFTANIVTLSRVFLVVPIAWFLK